VACYARGQSWDSQSFVARVRAGVEVSPSPRLDYVVSRTMTKSIRDSTKSRPVMGRPKTTGPGQPQVVRMHDQQVASIDAWIAMQGEAISRPEAIRRLVELGLEANK
jgi:hypothetical protein